MDKALNEKQFNITRVRAVASIMVFLFLAALVIEMLTLVGSPNASVFDLGAWGKKRILVVWIALAVAYILCRYFDTFSSLTKWGQCLLLRRRVILERVRYLVCGVVASGLLGVVFLGLASFSGIFSLNRSLALFAFAFASCIFLVYANRGSLAQSPERTFVPLGIVAGVLIAVLSPVQPAVSYDDQVHYDRALAFSYLSSPEYTKADTQMLLPPQIEGDVYGHLRFSENEYGSLVGELNKLGNEYDFSAEGFSSAWGYKTLGYSSLGYIPNALGLWLGRLLHLPFVAVFLLGRISSVLFFFTLVYFAVKRLRSQKVLALAFALIPSVLFISSNYSYDIWVIGWLLFGFLRYLSWLQRPDEKLSMKDILLVILSFVVGLGPKAIYFPIFILLLFIPRTKFPSRRFTVKYHAVVVGAILLVLSTFLLPFVMEGPGVGDVRGGGDVNSASQIMFVLEDPLRYLGILTNFLSGYLSISSSAMYTNLFAYLGTATLGGLPLVALMIIAATDSGGVNYSYALWRYRVAALALLLGTSALMASALYISYTAVGSDTVAGCQGRYLLPLILPFFALFFNSKIRNENTRKRYNLFVLSVSMLFVVVCVVELNLSVYVG